MRALRFGAFVTALLLLCGGCNLVDIALGRHASLTHMSPGGNIGDGQLECWLTLEFQRYPKDADLRDVKVRFESIALAEPAEFDWSYIARNDKIARGQRFGSGYREAEMTSPGKPPPLGEPTKVRFPLRAKKVIDNAPGVLYLEADLYWGGAKQDSLRAAIEHVYSRSSSRSDS